MTLKLAVKFFCERKQLNYYVWLYTFYYFYYIALSINKIKNVVIYILLVELWPKALRQENDSLGVLDLGQILPPKTASLFVLGDDMRF